MEISLGQWLLILFLVAVPLLYEWSATFKILQFMLLHIKYLYGIKIDVRGTENFNIKEPYVVELMYMGTVGLACWLGGIIFINRKKTKDAISVMSEAAQTMLSQDVRVWVFPEGTRNHNGSMLPFKRGAFHLAVQTQVPLIPVVISSYRDFYSKKDRRFTTGRCIVQVLSSVPTKGLRAEDVPALTDRVRQAMLAAFEGLSVDLGSPQ
ncbi:1-acyl-sn-glycerol-3-phosphate acyltransferase alpha, partial [Ophiophagus hannah]